LLRWGLCARDSLNAEHFDRACSGSRRVTFVRHVESCASGGIGERGGGIARRHAGSVVNDASIEHSRARRD